MNYIDIVIIIVLLIFIIQGYRKGLISALASLTALFVGVYAAFIFSDVTADFLITFFGFESKYLKAFSFVLTLVLVVIVIIAIGKILEKLLKVFLLGIFNSLAGAVFGLAKGFLFMSLLLMLLNYFQFTDKLISPEKREASKLFENVESFAPYLLHHFDFKGKIKQYNPLKKLTDEKKEAVKA